MIVALMLGANFNPKKKNAMFAPTPTMPRSRKFIMSDFLTLKYLIAKGNMIMVASKNRR